LSLILLVPWLPLLLVHNLRGVEHLWPLAGRGDVVEVNHKRGETLQGLGGAQLRGDGELDAQQELVAVEVEDRRLFQGHHPGGRLVGDADRQAAGVHIEPLVVAVESQVEGGERQLVVEVEA
jgi:hypothetical protein